MEYVLHYNDQQLKVLDVKPGITDYASLHYFNENEVLGNSDNPEKTYIEEVMPAKLTLNHQYVLEKSFLTDVKIMCRTFLKIVS